MRVIWFILKVWITMTLLAFIMIAVSTCARSETVTGPAQRVSDGDTLTVQGIRIRLNGVDAPEMDEPYGRQSRAAMIDIVDGRTLVCELGGVSYDRRVGVCFIDGQDIGAILIRQGLALDCPRYSGGRYRHLETNSNLRQKGYCK